MDVGLSSDIYRYDLVVKVDGPSGVDFAERKFIFTTPKNMAFLCLGGEFMTSFLMRFGSRLMSGSRSMNFRKLNNLMIDRFY